MNNRDAKKQKAKFDFLLQAYQSRLAYHGGQATRMLMRFNILLTIELALFAFFLKYFIDNPCATLIWLFPVLGFFLSVVWYMFSAQDRYLFELYRKQCVLLEKRLIEETEIKRFPRFNKLSRIPMNFLCWFTLRLGMTKLQVIFSLFFFCRMDIYDVSFVENLRCRKLHSVGASAILNLNSMA